MDLNKSYPHLFGNFQHRNWPAVCIVCGYVQVFPIDFSREVKIWFARKENPNLQILKPFIFFSFFLIHVKVRHCSPWDGTLDGTHQTFMAYPKMRPSMFYSQKTPSNKCNVNTSGTYSTTGSFAVVKLQLPTSPSSPWLPNFCRKSSQNSDNQNVSPKTTKHTFLISDSVHMAVLFWD